MNENKKIERHLESLKLILNWKWKQKNEGKDREYIFNNFMTYIWHREFLYTELKKLL